MLKDAGNNHWIFFYKKLGYIFFSSKAVDYLLVQRIFSPPLIKLCALVDLLIRNRLFKTGSEINLHLVCSASY